MLPRAQTLGHSKGPKERPEEIDFAFIPGQMHDCTGGVTQRWTRPLKLEDHLEDMATYEQPVTLYEYCTIITLFHTSEHLEVTQRFCCVSDDLFVGAILHRLKWFGISALCGRHWQNRAVTV